MAEREIAETVALRALAWLMGPADLAETFLGASGLSLEDLRLRATEPETLAAVLDFVLMDDQWVLAFAAAEGVTPERVTRARAALPGGNLPHWT